VCVCAAVTAAHAFSYFCSLSSLTPLHLYLLVSRSSHLHCTTDNALHSVELFDKKQHYSNGAALQVVGCNAQADTITMIDNRTGKKHDFPIVDNTVKIDALWKALKIRSYDPGYMNTASATSRICFIDGDKGILRYRGYPIEQLAEQSTFMEVSYLLLHGNLPSQQQLDYFEGRVMRHTYVHTDLQDMMKGFRYNAHPMGMVISAVAAMGTFYPEANPSLAGQDIYKDLDVRQKQIHRMLGTMPTIAAHAYRHRIGRPFVDPAPPERRYSYAENFLYMLDRMGHTHYKPNPRLAKALDVLFILHADHELNCSTAAMRHLSSSGVDVYSCVAGSTAALYGPRHGGANEAVLRMLEQIGSVENIPKFLADVKNKAHGVKLMGFGHRVYKNHDPRATIIRKLAEEVFSILGREPLIEIAVALEKIALSDEYFIKRKLYPNVDFYSGLIYKAMGFPTDYFPVLFTIPRTAGWLAHWNEFLDDPENRIIRPRQVYKGVDIREYTDIASRGAGEPTNLSGADGKALQHITSSASAESKRRESAAIAD
jgi:citrate synthase